MCGESNNVAMRMTSLPPKDAGGAGTRNNKRLRQYVGDNLADIEYRTKACADKAAAEAEESKMRDDNHYCF